MQQVIQPINGQATEVAQVPVPLCGANEVLIANRFSVISAGTERQTIELARQSLVGKARQRPDHVKRVLEKLRQEGIGPTIRQVRAKLSQPMPLGYASAGVVIQVGENVTEFQVGDAVASNGGHAEVVSVGKNLVARIPDDVPLDHACYAVIGSIALQGVRLARVGLGETVAVIGLGLIGQMTVNLLRQAGCQVVGADLDPSKCELARQMGAQWTGPPEQMGDAIKTLTQQNGADAVLLTAATTSDGPVNLAAQVARTRARVVAVGAVGLNVPRRDFYFKELELIVSCSYGPGRYDPQYEEKGVDYPIGHVRWTEQRNIQAVLDLMSQGRFQLDKLTTHQFDIDNAGQAYSMIEEGQTPYLGIVLKFGENPNLERRVNLPIEPTNHQAMAKSAPNVALENQSPLGITMVGAGNFASTTLLPIITQSPNIKKCGLISAGGLSGRSAGKRHQFAWCGTDLDQALIDNNTNALVIATRHHLHTPQALAGLKAGKHIFLEKPLAINNEQLDEWVDWFENRTDDDPIITMGYNRRFAPASQMLRQQLEKIDDPKTLTVRFNAGAIPADHWIHDADVGGGRIVGEACHAIDLATYLIGSVPVKVFAESVGGPRAATLQDEVNITVRHADGSVSNILYTAGGDRGMSKERIEVFGGGLAGVIDDFRMIDVRRNGRKLVRKKWWNQQKGYTEEWQAFLQAIATNRPSIAYRDLLAVSTTALRCLDALRLDMPLEV